MARSQGDDARSDCQQRHDCGDLGEEHGARPQALPPRWRGTARQRLGGETLDAGMHLRRGGRGNGEALQLAAELAFDLALEVGVDAVVAHGTSSSLGRIDRSA